MAEIDEFSIESLLIGNSEFDELERTLDIFCPFEAVGMVRQEIRHGYFLSYIFDPLRPHGFGTECLKAFVAALAKSQTESFFELTRLDVHLKDFDYAEVRREWRNIDLLINIPSEKIIIAIELKIDASEHSGQLERYKKTVTSEWPDHNCIFVFLTKRGDDGSDEGWHSLEMEALAQELDAIVMKQTGGKQAQAMLAAYLGMLRRHHLTNDRLEKLASRLWQKHRGALEFLMHRQPDMLSDLFSQILGQKKEICDKLSSQLQFKVSVEHETPGRILFSVHDWDNTPGMLSAKEWTPSGRLILLEVVKHRTAGKIRAYMVLGPGDTIARENIYSKLSNSGASVGKRGKLAPERHRLASETIALVKEGIESEIAASEIIETFVKFASKHLSACNIALRG
jgi:hypothetical protein